jgi:glycine reductase complex component B subunit gamma
MHEHLEAGLTAVSGALQEYRPDLLVAGPAFNAGRYGLACAQACRLAQATLHLPSLTAMHPENPGVYLPGLRLYIVPSAASVAGMGEMLPSLARLALKVGRGKAVGPAREEGYLLRRLRKNVLSPCCWRSSMGKD